MFGQPRQLRSVGLCLTLIVSLAFFCASIPHAHGRSALCLSAGCFVFFEEKPCTSGFPVAASVRNPRIRFCRVVWTDDTTAVSGSVSPTQAGPHQIVFALLVCSRVAVGFFSFLYVKSIVVEDSWDAVE